MLAVASQDVADAKYCLTGKAAEKARAEKKALAAAKAKARKKAKSAAKARKKSRR